MHLIFAYKKYLYEKPQMEYNFRNWKYCLEKWFCISGKKMHEILKIKLADSNSKEEVKPLFWHEKTAKITNAGKNIKIIMNVLQFYEKTFVNYK